MDKNSQTLAAGLYIVATPIGNLGDITLRALDVLRSADIIACEDTRTSAKLFSHFGIQASTTSYHDHNSHAKRPQIIQLLQEGKTVALISDAGTPLISDPGYKLVKEATALGISVFPIPGASSVTAALSVCGLPTDRFFYCGFLPAKAQARDREIAKLATIPATLVILESVHRLHATLTALAKVLGEREAVISREMTKLHEEFRRASLPALTAHYEKNGNPKGEVVITIAPPIAPETPSIHTVEAMLQDALRTASVKDASSHVAKETGLPRQEVYALALKIAALKSST